MILYFSKHLMRKECSFKAQKSAGTEEQDVFYSPVFQVDGHSLISEKILSVILLTLSADSSIPCKSCN